MQQQVVSAKYNFCDCARSNDGWNIFICKAYGDESNVFCLAALKFGFRILHASSLFGNLGIAENRGDWCNF